MNAVVYRKRQRESWRSDIDTDDRQHSLDETRLPHLLQEAEAWHPALFYPRVSESELAMWTQWLPTTIVFEGRCATSRHALCATLAHLSAPQDVVDECQWAWALDLFEAYELRTPERRDLRDPLVLGRLGTQRYRMALWGESLRPLEEIRHLVQDSLKLRKRATRWQTWSLVSGALLGLTCGLWMTSQLTFELWMASQRSYLGEQLGVSMVSALFGSFCLGLPFLLHSPETRQQHFLDQYRQ